MSPAQPATTGSSPRSRMASPLVSSSNTTTSGPVASSPSPLPLSSIPENIMRGPNSLLSPRSQINAKIRGSLNNLTASLDATSGLSANSSSGDSDLGIPLYY